MNATSFNQFAASIKASLYSKEESLSDITKSIYALESDAVPDDVFKILSKPYKVGDIFTTMRTNLGETWRLCNGEDINGTEFPEYNALYKEQHGDAFSLGRVAMTDKAGHLTGAINGIKFLDNKWVAYGAVANNGYIPALFVTSDPCGIWEVKILSAEVDQIRALAYANNAWVAVSGYNSTCYAYVSTDSMATWTRNNMRIGLGFSKDILYSDGTWAVPVQNYNNALYVCYTSDPLGKWTDKNITTEPYYPDNMCYQNGYWNIACRNAYNMHPFKWRASALDGSWELTNIGSNLENAGGRLFYSGDVWTYVCMANSGFTVVTNANGSTTTAVKDSKYLQFEDACYEDGMIYVFCRDSSTSMPVIYYTSTPEEVRKAAASQSWEVFMKENDLSLSAFRGAVKNGSVVCIGHSGESEKNLYVYSDAMIPLPLISESDLIHTYVKVKGDKGGAGT